MQSLSITILGCGTSSGVPSIHQGWGSTDPNNPKNRRMRACVAIKTDDCHVLVDFGPDIKHQLVEYGQVDFDAVFCTHEHADHIHGIDDLRWVCIKNQSPLPLYARQRTLDSLQNRFLYTFGDLPEGVGYYRPVLLPHAIDDTISINDSTFTVIEQNHGKRMNSIGFRIGDFAYCTDVVDFSPEQFEKLQGVKVWVVDALRQEPHPTHAHVNKVLEWVETLQPEKTYLTHMDTTMDYDTLMQELPKSVEPAYDGLVIRL